MERYQPEREHPRARVDLAVEVEVVGGTSTGRIVDIGAQGLRYVRPAEATPEEDREVMLRFTLPGDDQELRVLGWIAGTSVDEGQRSVSVTFFSLPEQEAERIARFVASQE